MSRWRAVLWEDMLPRTCYALCGTEIGSPRPLPRGIRHAVGVCVGGNNSSIVRVFEMVKRGTPGAKSNQMLQPAGLVQIVPGMCLISRWSHRHLLVQQYAPIP
eukprot:3369914-Rhodomonas_salina.3